MGSEGRRQEAATATSAVAGKVRAGILWLPGIGCSRWQRGGGLMERFAHSQDFRSQVRVETRGSSIVGFEWGGFCQHKTNRARVENSRGIQCPVYLGVCMYVREGKIFRDRESRDDVEKTAGGGGRGGGRERADWGKKKREADRRGSLSLGLQTTVSFLKPEPCAHGRGWGGGGVFLLGVREPEGSAVHPIILLLRVTRRCTTIGKKKRKKEFGLAI